MQTDKGSAKAKAKANSSKSITKIARIIWHERVGKKPVLRTAEPTMVMDSKEQVEAFDEAGASMASVRSSYFFNVQALSRLVPPNGTLLDLCCGSGQFLFEFKKARPDVRILAVDLSSEMLARAKDHAAQNGLEIEWIEGDVTTYLPSEKIDCISCVYAFHHLPTIELFSKAVENIQRIVKRDSCNVWFFDLCRPRSERTIQLYPEAFSPEAKKDFKVDSQNSLRAAFDAQEFRQELKRYLGDKILVERCSIIPLYQCAFLAQKTYENAIKIEMTAAEKFNTQFMRWMFAKVVSALKI